MRIKLIKAALLMIACCSGGVMAISQQYLKLDTALINEARIEYWLKKRNELAPDATKAQVKVAVGQYIDAYKSTLQRSRPITVNKKNSIVSNQAKRSSITKMRVASPSKIDANTAIEVNILAILIDFPDLKYNNNRLSSSDTMMYYSNYSLEHYRDMLFSDTGFSGPSGEKLLSSRQYYKEESGDSFSFSGQVYGWYTAEKNAAYYGRNGGGDDDLNTGTLVLEAVNAAVASGQVSLADFDQQDPGDLDNDGNLEEADGVIDHLVVFHSSIGEEAGGGVLAEDAIWSHRFYVANTPQAVIGSHIKVDGYTIQPIDSAAGVISHEFGHDLGLPDEYDTKSSDVGSPVANWSIMASGSWLGDIFGTEPNSFSPYARDFLQQTYGGNWINQLELDIKDLNQAGLEVELVEGVNHHGGVNQIKIKLPQQVKEFIQPFSGRYQYYSTHKNNANSKLSFSTVLPNDASVKLSMQAQWNTEKNYDYVQIKANGMPLANNFTTNDLTGKSNVITGASAAAQWQTLTFDLSAYAGESVNLEIAYISDSAVGGFGFVVDDLKITTGSTTVFFNDAESTSLTLDGFKKITSNYLLEPQYYYIQLRSHNGLDQSLASVNYTTGILMWLADSNYDDNHVDDHPGHGFLAVIDADQQMIGIGNSLTQVRDAAFSLYNQSAYPNDNHTANISKFDDSIDYSAATQPQSGVKVTQWGITMNVIDQAINSSAAKIDLARTFHPLTAKFDISKDGLVVAFNQKSISSVAIDSYQWNFGDSSSRSNESNLAAPIHTYSQAGQYNVSLSVHDVAGNNDVLTEQIVVADKLELTVNRRSTFLDATFIAQVSGGMAPYQYQWNFGDNTAIQTGAEVNHSFAQAGRYQIEVTVTDDAEQVKTLLFEFDVEFQMDTNSALGQVVSKSGGSFPFISLVAGFMLLVSRIISANIKPDSYPIVSRSGAGVWDRTSTGD